MRSLSRWLILIGAGVAEASAVGAGIRGIAGASGDSHSFGIEFAPVDFSAHSANRDTADICECAYDPFPVLGFSFHLTPAEPAALQAADLASERGTFGGRGMSDFHGFHSTPTAQSAARTWLQSVQPNKKKAA